MDESISNNTDLLQKNKHIVQNQANKDIEKIVETLDQEINAVRN